MQENSNIIIKKNNLEFRNFKKISFPTICIICGKNTNSKFKKHIKTIYNEKKTERKDLKFKLPICKTCQYKSDEKVLYSTKKKVILFSILGASLGVLLSFLTFSYIFGISIFVLFFLPLYFYYKRQKGKQIELEKYIRIEIEDYGNTIKMSFLNNKYAQCLHLINLEKSKENLKSKTEPNESSLGIIKI